jgi:hypothetical protein
MRRLVERSLDLVISPAFKNNAAYPGLRVEGPRKAERALFYSSLCRTGMKADSCWLMLSSTVCLTYYLTQIARSRARCVNNVEEGRAASKGPH